MNYYFSILKIYFSFNIKTIAPSFIRSIFVYLIRQRVFKTDKL